MESNGFSSSRSNILPEVTYRGSHRELSRSVKCAVVTIAVVFGLLLLFVVAILMLIAVAEVVETTPAPHTTGEMSETIRKINEDLDQRPETDKRSPKGKRN